MEVYQNVDLLYDSIVKGEISELDLEIALGNIYNKGFASGLRNEVPSFEDALDDVLTDLKL